jgi:hypothetical protein
VHHHHPAARKEAEEERGLDLAGERGDDEQQPREKKQQQQGEGDLNKGGGKKDIRALTTSLAEAVREWEGRNRVQLLLGGV